MVLNVDIIRRDSSSCELTFQSRVGWRLPFGSLTDNSCKKQRSKIGSTSFRFPVNRDKYRQEMASVPAVRVKFRTEDIDDLRYRHREWTEKGLVNVKEGNYR